MLKDPNPEALHRNMETARKIMEEAREAREALERHRARMLKRTSCASGLQGRSPSAKSFDKMPPFSVPNEEAI